MYTIAIVGAMGLVGRQLVELLEERNFPVQQLVLLDADEAVGEFLEFNAESVPVQLLSDDSFAAVNIAMFCGSAAVSREFCPAAVAAGAICIDNSGVWNQDDDVPLVVAEVNPDEIASYSSKRTIASPGSAAMQLSLPLKALYDHSVVERVVITAMQAISEAGEKAVDELREQSGELLNGRPTKNKVFSQQVGFNCVPQVGSLVLNGGGIAIQPELVLAAEIQKIFADEKLSVAATLIHVPVFYGNSQVVNIQTSASISTNKANELLNAFANVEVMDESDGDLPMPVDVVGQDCVVIGRVRVDPTVAHGLNMWSVADNIRQGAATNMVQIAELLVEKHLS